MSRTTMMKAMAVAVVVAFASAASVTLTSAGPKSTGKPIPGLEGNLSNIHDRNCGKGSMFCIESPRSTKKALPGYESPRSTRKALPGLEGPKSIGKPMPGWERLYWSLRSIFGLR